MHLSLTLPRVLLPLIIQFYSSSPPPPPPRSSSFDSLGQDLVQSLDVHGSS